MLTIGLNSGVMLMNLTRIRQLDWEKYILDIYHDYNTQLALGDQDILNIFFHFHPELLYLYPCNNNYRTDHWYICILPCILLTCKNV